MLTLSQHARKHLQHMDEKAQPPLVPSPSVYAETQQSNTPLTLLRCRSVCFICIRHDSFAINKEQCCCNKIAWIKCSFPKHENTYYRNT